MDTSILRKWDIRGIYPTQINEEVASIIGYAYAVYLKEKNVFKTTTELSLANHLKVALLKAITD